jgi:hypothetical protein
MTQETQSMPDQLIIDDILQFPIYHGTSSIFLESILKHGLGGRNILEEHKIHELFVELYDAYFSWLDKNRNLCPEMMAWENMRDQNITGGGFNFQYGDVYGCFAKKKAEHYANVNKYGSELLSHLIELTRILADQKTLSIAHSIKVNDRLSSIVGKYEPKPITVCIDNVKVSDLKMENGDDPYESLTFLSQEYEKFVNDRAEINETKFRAKNKDSESLKKYWADFTRYKETDQEAIKRLNEGLLNMYCFRLLSSFKIEDSDIEFII